MGVISDSAKGLQDWLFSDEPSLIGSSQAIISTNAGVDVTPGRALSIGAYWACIQNIASDLAKLPIDVFRRIDVGQNERVLATTQGQILNRRANDTMSAFNLLQTKFQYTLGSGNGVSEIIRDRRERPRELKLIEPYRVKFDRVAGKPVYEVQADPKSKFRKKPVNLTPQEVVHFRGMGNGSWGYSILHFQAECLAMSLATQGFANRFFANGTMAGSVATHPGPISDEYETRLNKNLKEFRKKENQHRTLVMEEGGKLDMLGIPLREAQFIELMQFSVSEIARWFRMPLHMIQNMDGAKFNNVEMTGIEYVKDALLMWATMAEQELNWKLFPDNEEMFVNFDFTALLRGDSKARAELYKARHALGSLNANEIRAKEGDPPGPTELDEFFMQLNMSTVDHIVEGRNLKDSSPGDADGFPAQNEDPESPASDEVTTSSVSGDQSTIEIPLESKNGNGTVRLEQELKPLISEIAEAIAAKEKKVISAKLAKLTRANSSPQSIEREMSNFYGELHNDYCVRLTTACGLIGIDKEPFSAFCQHYVNARKRAIIEGIVSSGDVATFERGDIFVSSLYKTFVEVKTYE